MSPIEKAETLVAPLERKRLAHVEKGVALADERAAISFRVHADADSKARAGLTEINNQLIAHASELESICAAQKEAAARLAAARAAEARKADRAQAIEARKAWSEFRKLWREAFEGLNVWAEKSVAAQAALRRMHAAGIANPSDQQFAVLGGLCLRTKVGQTPWDRLVERTAPSERKTWSELDAAWSGMVERVVAQRLGENQTNEEEAA
jgi:hypothetical protein